MRGYAGRILRVDLEDKSARTVPLSKDMARDCIGGKGLGARILLDEMKQGTDPLSPENLLVLATGPLTGTKAPTSNRFGAFFRSPLTGIWGGIVLRRASGPSHQEGGL